MGRAGVSPETIDLSVGGKRQTERIRHYLSEHLRPGLSVKEAGERYCALASPDLYHLLTVDLGWTPDQHRDWLTELVRTELL